MSRELSENGRIVVLRLIKEGSGRIMNGGSGVSGFRKKGNESDTTMYSELVDRRRNSE